MKILSFSNKSDKVYILYEWFTDDLKLPVSVFCTRYDFATFTFFKGCLYPFRVSKRKL